MRVLYLLVLLSILFTPFVFSQETGRSQATDTLVTEEVVYEIDTVYLEPDTINLSDTIVHFERQAKFPLFFEMAGSSFLSGIYDFSSIATLTVKSALNYSASITIAYSYKSFFWGVNIGFTQLEENITDPGISYVIKTPNSTDGFADSLVYSGSCAFKNYYNYLNTGIIFGKKWGGSKRFNYRGIANLGCDILLRHQAISVLSDANNRVPISNEDLREITFSLGLAVSIDYKLGRTIDLFLSPYGKTSLKMKKDYPLSNLAMIGLNLGVRKYL